MPRERRRPQKPKQPRLRGHQHHHHHQQQQQQQVRRDVLLVLHGNHQTGELLLGRIDRLTKRLRRDFGIDAIAPDAPFDAEAIGSGVDDDDDDDDDRPMMKTWWHRGEGNSYVGLEDSLGAIRSVQEEVEEEEEASSPSSSSRRRIVGILGFSQGARLGHLLAVLHRKHPDTWLPHLRFAVLVAGYDKPLPPELIPYLDDDGSDDRDFDDGRPLSLPSLHVWGSGDALITRDEFEGLAASYRDAETYIHPGKHHVPTKGSEIPVYVDFVRRAVMARPPPPMSSSSSSGDVTTAAPAQPPREEKPDPTPDEETAELQRDEVRALEAIYPDALDLRSDRTVDDDGEDVFAFPIVYRIVLNDMEMDQDDDDDDETTNWPKHQLTVEVEYPVKYPSDDDDDDDGGADAINVPRFRLLHQNTVFEFPSAISGRLTSILKETARNEQGMPCVLSCLYAAREFLDEDRDWTALTTAPCAPPDDETDAAGGEQHEEEGAPTGYEAGKERHPLIRPSSLSEIREGTLEGLEIAETLLRTKRNRPLSGDDASSSSSSSSSTPSKALYRGGGSFGTYTIGLVGKPSAGKSTFFNAATAFSRQRGQNQEAAAGGGGSAGDGGDAGPNDGLGGASMAAHPFTTIDPNVGFCLVPAPPGSCPEDDHPLLGGSGEFGSTHGRDANGRRFLPVLLKDVAGLVPGAYQGKGRGNQFLNDLTDAAVLIHVVDASGSADAAGNTIVADPGDPAAGANGESDDAQDLTNPLDDLAWIRAELVEWVYVNLVAKWEVISRKGRSKLADMFSGYGQKIDMAETVFPALEIFLEERYRRDRALDNIDEWNEADVQRLVSLFLGVRFPMALALNKHDLPSSKAFVDTVRESLPVHGAHVGTPLSARREMAFVRDRMLAATPDSATAVGTTAPPRGVWDCLGSALRLREPVLVFPVSDATTMAPMASLTKTAVGDPSLPGAGMVRCIAASGGTPPTCWDGDRGHYAPVPTDGNGGGTDVALPSRLRDVLPMKPGSTVEDVFWALKRLGALSGEFVRAEATSGAPGERPKPAAKHEPITERNRVLKIMTNKRTQWQHTAPEKKERSRYQKTRS